jgi:hypothetical protein
MKVFKETIEEAANRLSEGTLIACLFFAFIGIIAIVTQRWVEGWEFLGTYREIEGPLALVLGFGVALSLWSFLTLWICYFRRVRRILPSMCSQINWFLVLVGACLVVPVLPVLVYIPRIYRMISLVILFGSAHFFHKRVRAAVSKLMKQMEGDQNNE